MPEGVDSSVHPIDRMGDVEIMRELVAFFGAQRVVELFGWAILAGLVSEFVSGGDPAALRRQLEQRGFTSASFYRALRDLRRFGEHIEGRTYPAQDHRPTVRILERIGTLKVA